MSPSAALSASPWQRADVIKMAGLVVIGAILWTIGWYQVSDRAAMDEQVVPMNLAIVGMLVIAVGQASWFLAGRRSVGARRRALLGAEAKARQVNLAETAVDLVAGAERFYHRLDCVMLTDRNWTPTPRATQHAQGRIPCGVCGP